MRRIYTERSLVMEVPATVMYELIADYHNGHPRIVPPDVFSNMQVEEGGRGAGTIVTFDVTAMGRKQNYRAFVTEPEPGRVLTETYPDPKVPVDETTFTVTPLEDGKHIKVKISTYMQVRDGWIGALEKTLAVSFLEKTYEKELKRMASVAQESLLVS